MESEQAKPLLQALAGKTVSPPPWWLMRQAGRYLPEYRSTRAKARDFVEFCLTPVLAAEATLQPVRRFGMDGAILFSDILLVPYALGQRLAFREGEGPALDPVVDNAGVRRLERGRVLSRLEPVFEAVQRVHAALGRTTALIGFAGAPWTVAVYMVEGGPSKDFRLVKGWAYRDPEGFGLLIDALAESTVEFISGQIEAGVEIVQLFDSWAGILPEPEFERWVIEPTKRIVVALKARFPDLPLIGFPRGAGLLYERYVTATGVDAVGLDTSVPTGFACARLQPAVTVQGNLDPVVLTTGGLALETGVKRLRKAFENGPWVFNLGHGVLPQTPPENVAALARLLTEPDSVA